MPLSELDARTFNRLKWFAWSTLVHIFTSFNVMLSFWALSQKLTSFSTTQLRTAAAGAPMMSVPTSEALISFHSWRKPHLPGRG